jgi:hypothetical protein
MSARQAARVALALAPLLAASAAWAGPWPVGPGHAYVKLGYAHLRSTVLANPDGSTADIPRFTKQELYVYGAVGLTPGLTAIVSAPLWRSSDLEDFQRESGFGDVQFGLQAQLGRSGPWTFALRGLAQAPTGDVTRAEGLLPTGSGVWEGELRVSAGRSLAGGRGYGFVEVGHQTRETLRDGLVYDAQVGWNLGPRAVLAVNLRGLEPYDKAPRDTALGSPVGVGDRVTYLTYGPSLIVKLGAGWGAQLDVTGVARARNLARGPQLGLGLTYSR